MSSKKSSATSHKKVDAAAAKEQRLAAQQKKLSEVTITSLGRPFAGKNGGICSAWAHGGKLSTKNKPQLCAAFATDIVNTALLAHTMASSRRANEDSEGGFIILARDAVEALRVRNLPVPKEYSGGVGYDCPMTILKKKELKESKKKPKAAAKEDEEMKEEKSESEEEEEKENTPPPTQPTKKEEARAAKKPKRV